MADSDSILPLHRHGEVVGYCLIEPDDREWASQWRWSLAKDRAVRWIRVEGKNVALQLARELLDLPRGAGHGGLVADHINGGTLDNRRENLRAVTMSENARNRRTRNATGFKGVSERWDGGGYEAKVSLGTFSSPEEAATAVERTEAWLGLQPFTRHLRAVS